MTQAEMELELSGLRRQLTEFAGQDEARRRTARRLAYGDLGVAFALIMFSLVLYLNHERLYIALFLCALVLIILGSNLMALAAPRTAEDNGGNA
jgi:hypothetical protein